MRKLLKLITNLFLGIPRFVFALMFWIAILFLLSGLLFRFRMRETIEEGDVLYLMPSGYILDEYSTPPLQRQIEYALSYGNGETRLSDLKEAVERAALDPRISAIFLDLRMFAGAGTAVMEDFQRSLIRFKRSDKPIHVYTSFIGQRELTLSLLADETVIDPMGEVVIKGYGLFRAYYKKGLDKWGIKVHVFKAGKNKTFVEAMESSGMSRDEKKSVHVYLDDLWESWLTQASLVSGLNKDHFTSYADRYGTRLLESHLTSAEFASEYGFVDRIMTYDFFEQEMITRYGIDEKGGFNQIFWTDYLDKTNKWRNPVLTGNNSIALLYLTGPILWGRGDWDDISSTAVQDVMDQIYSNPNVSAIVIRLDTPGGSALGAEEIRRELEKAHNYGIPLIVSMGNTTASGGYWIASEADEIWTEETTLTGSIGVFSYYFTAREGLDENLGITVDGVGTTDLAGGYHWGLDPSKEIKNKLQAEVEQTYRIFLQLVGRRRNLKENDVERLADGQVWTGRQAVENGLADHVGGVQEAIERAAELSGLKKGYHVIEFRDEDYLYASSMTALPGMLSRIFSGNRESFLGDLGTDKSMILNKEQDHLFLWSPYEIIH